MPENTKISLHFSSLLIQPSYNKEQPFTWLPEPGHLHSGMLEKLGFLAQPSISTMMFDHSITVLTSTDTQSLSKSPFYNAYLRHRSNTWGFEDKTHSYVCRDLKRVPLLLFKLLSHVQLFDTLWTVDHRSPLSMGFPRQ